MTGSALQSLMDTTIGSSIAILVVSALRKPLRRIAGARVAYGLWLAIPAIVFAVWLPAAPSLQSTAYSIQKPLTVVIPHTLVTSASIGSAGAHATMALVIWLSGTCLMAGWLFFRQRAFRRSLGCVAPGTDGFLRSERIAAPMLVGAWRPRVIVPANFEARYPYEDRVLMLAHEYAHRERGDAVANLLATVSLCVLWFNPLMYWGLGRFRFDQELACDAYVLANCSSSKKHYANALLRAQLTSETMWQVPVGCHWQSNHPLKERITMLRYPSPGLSRRLTGIAVAVVVTVASAYAVSSSFAQAPAHAASGTADKKFSIEAKNTDTREILAMIARKGNTNILVGDKVSGKMTVNLKDVTWRQALNIVVQSEGLVSRQSGDITIVGVAR